MTGEQHMPAMKEYTPKLSDLREVWIEAQDITWGRGMDDHGAEFDRAIAAHDAEVRALPDRETIARAIFETGTTDLDWDLVDGEERKWYLAVADAVLALFGQEVAR